MNSLKPFFSIMIAALIGVSFLTAPVMAHAADDGAPVKASAKKKKKKAKKKSLLTPVPVSGSKGAKLTPNSKLSRDIVFDGTTIDGKYHSAGEAVSKVEQEKKMNNLIGLRRDFKDRLTAERERLKRGEAVAAE